MKHLMMMTALTAGVLAYAGAALAHGHPELPEELQGLLARPDPNDALAHHDTATLGVISSGPSASVTKNLTVAGRGERLMPNATTDVWAHDRYAYIGTFNDPCGGTDETAGVNIFYTANKTQPQKVGVILSPEGSRVNDVKVATMTGGNILVHSNEQCGAGGVGGFEIYNVDNPAAPVHLSSVRVDEMNPVVDWLFGGITDVGVHNLWLFSQGSKDYVAAVTEGVFDNFQVFEITDPANPTFVTAWGAEEILDPGVGEELQDVNRVLNAALWMLDGYGSSRQRFLHDITVNTDGDMAYLSNWDAGLVLLDMTDVANPVFVSTALDPANGSLDGEVNSHAAWPTADGSIVVETEEDFDAWEDDTPPTNLTLDGTSTPGDPTIPATAISTGAGDTLEAYPTGLAVKSDGVTVEVTSGALAGSVFAAAALTSAAGSPTFTDTGELSGNLVWLGRACTQTAGDTLENADALNPGDIAIVRRGACEFQEKADAAAAIGASAVIIANNVPVTPWAGARIWDYSDPANPVLLSLFDTECSASTSPGEICNPAGTYSIHNVVVEGNKAYFSWYTDGVVIIDISDPANPVETARFSGSGPAFEESNGGIQDVWGIYKVPGEPWLYASDRNGGLYILKEYGSGSSKKGKVAMVSN